MATQCSPHPTDEGSRPRVTQTRCIPTDPRRTEQTKRPNILWAATILPLRQSSKGPPTEPPQQMVPAPDDQGLCAPDPAGGQPPRAPTCEVGVPTSPRAHILTLTRTTVPRERCAPPEGSVAQGLDVMLRSSRCDADGSLLVCFLGRPPQPLGNLPRVNNVLADAPPFALPE